MDFSSANTALWAPLIQLGIIATLILVANVLRRKIALIRNSLMPTAVLAGFLMLLLRNMGFEVIDGVFLETVTYHAIALGFIALALRVPEETEGESKLLAPKNGALIVSTYLVQALTGLLISLALPSLPHCRLCLSVSASTFIDWPYLPEHIPSCQGQYSVTV